jgi:hypothetical protein
MGYRSEAETGGFTARSQVQLGGGALALSAGSFLSFMAIYGLRLGLGDTLAQVGSLWLVTIFPLWASAWVACRFAFSSRARAGAGMAAFLVACILPVAGLWMGPSLIAIIALLTVASIGLGFAVWWTALRTAKAAMLVAALVSALLLIVTTLPGRFVLPEQLLLGFAPTDEYFHTSLAGMVARYHRFTIGGDGLAFFSYHFLSHLIAAGTARAAGTDVPHVYLYWGALSLKVQLLWAFFMGTLFLSRAENPPRMLMWRLAYAWLAVMAATAFESESYVAGAAFGVATLPFLLTLDIRPADSTIRLLGLVLLAVLAALVCTAAKITSGFFVCIALALAGWRMRARPVVTGIAAVSLLAIAAFTYLKVLPRGSAAMSVMDLVSSYSQYFTWQSFFSYLLPAVVAGLYLWRPRLSDQASASGWMIIQEGKLPRGWRGWWQWSQMSDPMPQFLLAALAACLLVLVTTPIGSNMSFFSLFLLTTTLLLLSPALEQVCAIPLDAALARPVLGGLIVVCGLSMAAVFPFYMWNDIANLQVEAQRVEHAPAEHLKDSIIQSLKTTHRPWTGLRALLDATPMARLRTMLAGRDAMAVHIDAGSTEMWRWLDGKSPYWCMAPQLPVPSLANVVELQSYAPKAIERECSHNGTNYYAPPDINVRRSVPVTDAALCRTGAKWGIRDIYVLKSLTDLSRNRDVICRF